MVVRSEFGVLLPECVSIVATGEDRPVARHWPLEEAVIKHVSPERRVEFRTTRECARAALEGLGYTGVKIPCGAHREPIWPVGVVGSLTHCSGMRAAAVARSTKLRALGIDVEPDSTLPSGVLDVIATEREVDMLPRLRSVDRTISWDRVLFSAKEAVFKAWFPVTGQWINYPDCCLDIDPVSGSFSAHFVDDFRRSGVSAKDLVGRWSVRNGMVFTAAHILATSLDEEPH